MRRYLEPTPIVSGRYGLALLPAAKPAAVTEAPLTAQQTRALGSYALARSPYPEPFAFADGLTAAPRRGRFQAWRCP